MHTFLFKWTPFFWVGIMLSTMVYGGLVMDKLPVGAGGVLWVLAMAFMLAHIVQSSLFPLNRWRRWFVEMALIVPWYLAVVPFLYNIWFREERGRIGVLFAVGSTLTDILPSIYACALCAMCLRLIVEHVRRFACFKSPEGQSAPRELTH
jgi:hypothetical protein